MRIAGMMLLSSVVLFGPGAPEARAALLPLGSGSDPIADAAERAAPSVVSVMTEHPGRPNPFGLRGGLPFDLPGAPPRGHHLPEGQGLGSGVIISADGEILTNNHVAADASKIRVRLSDGRELEAKVIGTDPATDLALLKVDARGLTPLPFGDSSRLRLGETVLAVGNPFGVGQTVTMGIVSAKGKNNVGLADYEDFIQTDAAINPGNSGGALVNLRGELVGINTAIFSRTGGTEGIGFAVPTRLAQPVLEQLRKDGHVSRGWLGVAIQELTPELKKVMHLEAQAGALVSDVVEGGPAQKAGVQSGDVIVGIDDHPVSSAAELRNTVALLGPGKKVEAQVLRDGERRSLPVTLQALKEDGGRGVVPGDEGGGRLQGLSLQPMSPAVREQLGVPARVGGGVLVAGLDPGSVAAQAGLREGDVILSAAGRAVTSAEVLQAAAADEHRPVLLRVWRGQGFLFLVLPGR